MKWPRGKYNGRRIVGIHFQAILNVTTWRWVPSFAAWEFAGGIHWLCILTWTNWKYEDRFHDHSND